MDGPLVVGAYDTDGWFGDQLADEVPDEGFVVDRSSVQVDVDLWSESPVACSS